VIGPGNRLEGGAESSLSCMYVRITELPQNPPSSHSMESGKAPWQIDDVSTVNDRTLGAV
jgi:hypothetical protein